MSKIINLCVAYMDVAGGVPMRGVSRSGSFVKLSNSPAIAGVPRLDFDDFESQSDSIRINQRFLSELSNSVDDPGLSIARARLEPGRITNWHFLSGVIERYVILEGLGRVEVGDIDPQQVSVGDVVIIPAQARQRIYNTGKNDLVFLAICSPRFDESVYTGV